jgi:hypothetical protein
MDGSAGTFTVLMPERKMYMQVTGQQVASMADSMKAHQQGSKGPSQLTVTPGGTETIAGETCTNYTISGVGADGKPGQGTVCATNGVGVVNPYATASGTPLGRMLTMNPQAAALVQAFRQINGKAILRVTGMKGDPKSVDLLVTKIDKSTPPDSLFQIPAGFTKFQMPAGMPGGMPGAGATPKQ